MTLIKTRFSAMQYYLAHARNSVHARVDLDRPLTEAQFHDLVEHLTAVAPHLLWAENLADSTHVQGWSGDLSQICHYIADANGPEADALMAEPLHDTGAPAFRAICLVMGGARSRIVFQTSHALMEGGDVAGLLRGRTAKLDTRPETGPALNWAAQVGILALAPVMFTLHLLAARFERKDRADFAFARLSFNRDDLRRAARRIGISQRDMAFALVAHHRRQVPAPKKGLSAAITSLPAHRVRLCDDEFLDVRVDDFRMPFSEDFGDFATAMAERIATNSDGGLAVQTGHRRLNQMHRSLHPRLPWLYPKTLFGFAPYDVVLSLLPPVKTGRAFALLDGARVLAGSDTGTAESCIFTASDAEVTVTLWSGAEREAHVAAIAETAQGLGIRCDRV